MTLAIRYALVRWEALTRFIDDGNIEVDNNICERDMRAVALVRKNCMFMRSDRGGQRAAAGASDSRNCSIENVRKDLFVLYQRLRCNSGKGSCYCGTRMAVGRFSLNASRALGFPSSGMR